MATNVKNSKCLVVNRMSLSSALAFVLLQGLVIVQEVQKMARNVKSHVLFIVNKMSLHS
jgi:ethanolamine utilization cobalamin adenosyltransferase